MALAAETTLNEALAVQYAADLLHGALLEAGEPIKASEAARLAGRDDVDLRLARVVLATHPNRFTSSDRKWTLWTRFADPGRSVERNLEEILKTAGRPVHIDALARELAAIYNRPNEVYETALRRILINRERYFTVGGARYVLSHALLETSVSTEEDVMFDNYLRASDLEPYAATFGGVDPRKIDTVIAALDAQMTPVPSKIVQYFAWHAAPQHFDAGAFLVRLLNDGRAYLLSDGNWIGPAVITRLARLFPAIAEREVDEHGDNTTAEVAQPLVVSDAESDQLVAAVLRNENTSHAGRLLEDIFEVSPGETTYEGDLRTVVDALRADDRVLWVGADRFLPTEGIPAYVFSVPEILNFPEVHFLDAEGNDVDLILEDEGFDGGLQREMMSGLARDVQDEEAIYTPEPNPPSTGRCVLKFHHKEIGTFPMCQLAPGFFPIEPTILQADIVLPTGQKAEVWVNNETRLLYGLIDWYSSLPVDSGAVFYLDRQAPDRYVLTYGEETEPSMFISRNRVNELLELGRRADSEEVPTFDILREIMEHYRKGIEFLTLLTEVNIARRTTRRTVASLLSGYHCFFQRGNAWVYDAKKLSQGFDKSKRKYLKK